jgi:D-sedoheptulose 7-phosphate isomerase
MRELKYLDFFYSESQQRKSLLTDLMGDCDFIRRVQSITEAMVDTVMNGNKLLICGNGGSACEAQHFAGELVGRFSKERRSIPAVALNADGGLLTCIGNDYGFENVFSRQLEGLYQNGDLLVALSTSGNSPNIVNVLERANELGADSIALLGKSGGAAKSKAFLPIVVPSDKTDQIQEIHLFLIHYFCHAIDFAILNA